jgi:hypothetical protein
MLVVESVEKKCLIVEPIFHFVVDCFCLLPKNIFVADTHFHMRPFGGPSIEFLKMIDILKKNGILFVQIEGIGQKILLDHYSDNQRQIVSTMTNDISNAEIMKIYKQSSSIDLHLSMTFPDLHKPEEIVKGIQFLDSKYPSLFNWMGEVNVVKQAIFKNGVTPITIDEIPKWKKFMRILRRRKMPLSLHCDLGNNQDPFLYLPLMREVLRLYPNNIIVWVHLGLCQELTNIDPTEHIQIMAELLSKHKYLYFDMSWRILYDQVFKDREKRKKYVSLFNSFPRRFLTGTDYVNSITKSEDDYREELRVTSIVMQDLNDEAYRYICLGQNYLDIIGSRYKAPRICL